MARAAEARPGRPRGRRERLILRELPDELLVYDLDRHRATCLNRTASVVFRLCDGTRSVPEIARAAEPELGVPADEALVRLAIDRLRRAYLLEPSSARPDPLTRREWVRRVGRLGLAAGLVPVVTSIVAPTAAQAATAIDPMDCRNLLPPCSGAPCVDEMGMSMGSCVPSGANMCGCH